MFIATNRALGVITRYSLKKGSRIASHLEKSTINKTLHQFRANFSSETGDENKKMPIGNLDSNINDKENSIVTSENSDIPPDNFYDENVELDKMFLDFAGTVMNGGSIKHMTTSKGTTWDELLPEPETLSGPKPSLSNFSMDEDDIGAIYKNLQEEAMEDSFSSDYNEDIEERDPLLDSLAVEDELAERLDHIQEGPLLTDDGDLDYSTRIIDPGINPLVDKFISNNASEKYRIDEQNLKACPGGRQRGGKFDIIKCHKIDLDEVNPFDIELLEKFISHDSEIMSKRKTGLCTKCQRKVAKTIKHSRCLGLMPHLGEMQKIDSNPLVRGFDLHEVVDGSKKINSKTIFKLK